MTSEQAQSVTAMLVGLQAAVATLSGVVARHAGLNPEDLARSFDAACKQLPADQPGRELTQLVLSQIAARIRSPGTPPDNDALLKRLSS